ncbi:SAM-dependent methyltransferase, partial [Streptomyces sp. NPDC005522]
MVTMTSEGTSIDATRPSIARLYDYLLGGKDNDAVDREIGDVFKRDLPGSVAIVFADRAALTRAVAEIATTTDVDQFIDLVSGLPTADNGHQVAQQHVPEVSANRYFPGAGVVGHAGARLLADLADVIGLTSAYSAALG